jgi:hypothetical protein
MDRVSYSSAYKTGKIISLKFILIFAFLETRRKTKDSKNELQQKIITNK